MSVKGLLIGSAAALGMTSAAQAADAIVATEREPLEYMRVCDAFGPGYFYIPGTETCLRVGGRVRFDATDNSPHDPDVDGTFTNTRVELYISSASDTEWGGLKTDMTARSDFDPHLDDANDGDFPDSTRTRLIVATVEFAGFTAGLHDSFYESFIDYAGNVEFDDVIDYGPSEVPMLAYTYDAGNGFSAFVSVEDDGQNNDDIPGHASDWPNFVGGVKFDNGTMLAGITAGYDESAEAAGIKGRVAGKFGNFNAFLMGAWNTDGNERHSYAPGDGLASWGDWALWAGGGYKFSEKLAANLQVAYTDNKTIAATGNLQWTPVPGLLFQSELAYTSWDNSVLDEDTLAGLLRVQRTF